MPVDREEDITIRLALAALDPESVEPAEMEVLLREAIMLIETLRAQVDRADGIGLDDIEPEGNA